MQYLKTLRRARQVSLKSSSPSPQSSEERGSGGEGQNRIVTQPLHPQSFSAEDEIAGSKEVLACHRLRGFHQARYQNVALLTTVTCAILLSTWALATDESKPPNILVVLVDDLRWDDLGCAGHPFSKTPNMDRIAAEGARFLNAFATTPLCSPSRACLLTGLYAHSHGITDNTERSAQSHQLVTFPQSLQRVGYKTAFIGKWHMGNDDSPRKGFDHWVCLKGQGSSFDPELNVNGESRKRAGYVTDILHEQAEDFLDQTHSKPFLLYFAHKAMHPELIQQADGSLNDPNASNFIPADRHRNLYAGETIPRRPNAIAAPQNKPALLRIIEDLPPLGPETGSTDKSILGRLRMLAAVDESLGELMKTLEMSGELDRTLVVVTSDHGYFYGEHGLSVERRLAYEEAIRIPLLMRLPGTIKPGSTPEEMVLTLDLAPTMLDLALAAPLATQHGRSLLPIFRGEATDWRHDFMVEYFSDKVFPRIKQMGYQAIRNDRWKLIQFTDLSGMDELYDLQSDPYEMRNLIADPGTKEMLDLLRTRLRKLVADSRSSDLHVEKLAAATAKLQSLVDNKKLAGAVIMVSRRGEVILADAVGLGRVETEQPMRLDSILRIYSMTKPITSVAVMQLIERGEIALDAPISKYLPEFESVRVASSEQVQDGQNPTSSVPTVRDLLRHTSGLTYGIFADTPIDREYRKAGILSMKDSNQVLIEKLSKIPLQYPPATRFHYSVSVDVLGRLIEVVSGNSLDEQFKQSIFEPLGMKDTGFYVPAEKADRFVDCFGPDEQGNLRTIELASTSPFLMKPTLQSGGGGLVSTAADYMRFCNMLCGYGEHQGVRLLKEETVLEMSRDQLPANAFPISVNGQKRDGVGFGLGFSVVVEEIPGFDYVPRGEYGWGGAASTHFWISPKDELAVVVLSQVKPFTFQCESAVKPIIYDAIR